jgi:hypothetical protein
MKKDTLAALPKAERIEDTSDPFPPLSSWGFIEGQLPSLHRLLNHHRRAPHTAHIAFLLGLLIREIALLQMKVEKLEARP